MPPFSLVWETQTRGTPAVDVLPIPPPLPDTIAGKPSYKADAPPPFFAWEGPGSDLPSSSATTTTTTTTTTATSPAAVLMPPTPPTQIYGRPSFKAEAPPVYYAWSGASGGGEIADKQTPTPTHDKVYGRPSFKAEAPPVYYAWSGASGEGEIADKQSPTPTHDKVYGRPSFKAEAPPVYYAWNGVPATDSDEKNIRQGSVDPSFVAGRPSVVVARPPYYYAWPEMQPPPQSAIHASPYFIKDARKVQHKDDNNTDVIPYSSAPPPATPQSLVAVATGSSSVPTRKTVQRGQGPSPSTPVHDRVVLKKKAITVDDSKMTMVVANPGARSRTALTKTAGAAVSKVAGPPMAIKKTKTGIVIEMGHVATAPRRAVIKVVDKGMINRSNVPMKQPRPVSTPVSVVRPRSAAGRVEGGDAPRDPTLVCMPCTIQPNHTITSTQLTNIRPCRTVRFNQ